MSPLMYRQMTNACQAFDVLAICEQILLCMAHPDGQAVTCLPNSVPWVNADLV